MLKFVSLSCLLWQLCVPFFSRNGKYKAYSFAWVVELSSSFVVKLKQCCGSYPFSPFFVIFGEFWGIFVLSDPFPYKRIVGKYSGEYLTKYIRFQSRIRSLYNLWLHPTCYTCIYYSEWHYYHFTKLQQVGVKGKHSRLLTNFVIKSLLWAMASLQLSQVVW